MKRTQPLRRRRKGPDATLTKHLDDASRDLCKARAGYRCEVCATGEHGVYSGKVLHAHHIVRSTRFALRFLPVNLVALCWSHHFAGSPAPAVAHGDIIAQANWLDWLTKHRPEDLEYVRVHAEDDGKMSPPEKRELLAVLRALRAEYREREAA